MWGTLVMPLGIVVEVLAPPALSRIFSYPMLLGMWIDTPHGGRRPPGPPDFEGPAGGLLGIAFGLALTWLCYVLLVRLVLWRVATGRAERAREPLRPR